MADLGTLNTKAGISKGPVKIRTVLLRMGTVRSRCVFGAAVPTTEVKLSGGVLRIKTPASFDGGSSNPPGVLWGSADWTGVLQGVTRVLGVPTPGVRVRLLRKGSLFCVAEVYSGAGGVFSFNHLPPLLGTDTLILATLPEGAPYGAIVVDNLVVLQP